MQKDWRLSWQRFAHLQAATITLGDLTVFVGPQATGKSLVLQLFKLVQDYGAVVATLKRYGMVAETPSLLSHAYFGEGYDVLREARGLTWKGNTIPVHRLLEKEEGKERVFYIPSQRALIFHQGSWPRPFSDYRKGDPYVVRRFSESLRQFLDLGLGGQSGLVFPMKRRLRQPVRERIFTDIFRGATLRVVTEAGQKRLVLETQRQYRLPYLSWTSGQREFIPLLLGFYWLLPLGRTNRRREVQWVVLEEPEMGLHPRAVVDVLTLILELLYRGYRVLLSTHSSDVLELIWALQAIQHLPPQQAQARSRLFLKLLDLPAHPHTRGLADAVLSKRIRVYAFVPQDGEIAVKDISSLSAFDPDADVAEWGGLTAFATRANEVVAECAALLEEPLHV